MSRYIDAYSLLESLEKQRAGANDQMFKIGMNTAMQIVEWHRTADVEEVRYGEWRLIEEDVDGNGNNQYRCSLCEAGELHAPFVIVPYCWKCGARMQKEKEE